MIWQFRYTLMREPKALGKFVKSVDWVDAHQSQHAHELLQQWAEIDVDDALELLSAADPTVRAHAVARLEHASDQILQQFLLQLVQALRYELNVGEVAKPVEGSRLARLLITRAAANPVFASYFWWYLQVAAAHPLLSGVYEHVNAQFQFELQQSPAGQALLADLSQQTILVARLEEMALAVQKYTDRMQQIGYLKKELSPKGVFQDLLKFKTPCRLPINPELVVTGIDPSTVYVFKSAKKPIRLTFNCTDGSKYTIIFKCGDDVRQDQIIIQMIALMDALLKRENLDLQLTPYRVLATGVATGMVECVPDSLTLKEILVEHGGLSRFLASHSADDRQRLISQDIFIKSCAGYCAITYLLGIGDRHLENLMLKKDGRLFHIDFGYILGHDPKPYPPPMKIVEDMLAAMSNVSLFKTYGCEAFNILRKSTNLILNLFVLMADAGVHDLDDDTDKVLLKLEKNFRKDLSEAEAVAYFQTLISDSVSALMPKVMEMMHSIAQAMRA